MPPEGSTRAGILPGCPSLDRASREAEVGFESRTFRWLLMRSPSLAVGLQTFRTIRGDIVCAHHRQLRTDDASSYDEETSASPLPISANRSTAT
ncbi:hypothetical protein T265_00905 [Opisthorchis viverrini]|uniref:Uncharacterized protein n=1 Tax=Opisthorchis viverrini TaxID=6198 RepID=A0A075A0K9_OPIVI|nr:hypothetical protein T265_00905 [Opisthorchis viverrini]KER33218.1 hypothetical protein T265_00905 [Opisthorchis viverrini]